MQTVPSILEKDAPSLFYQIDRLSPYFSRFQIDIADGIFVPNKTVQVEEIISFFQSKDFITLQTFSFDFHLMVQDYKTEINKLERLKKQIKINYAFIHLGLCPPNAYFLTPNLHFSIGLTLSPQDQVSDLTNRYALNTIPCLQIMSVSPGFQGSSFLAETLIKIEQLRQIGYRKEIFLDGAVNKKTIPVILAKKYQPDFICPGSYLTKTKTLEKNVEYLNKL